MEISYLRAVVTCLPVVGKIVEKYYADSDISKLASFSASVKALLDRGGVTRQELARAQLEKSSLKNQYVVYALCNVARHVVEIASLVAFVAFGVLAPEIALVLSLVPCYELISFCYELISFYFGRPLEDGSVTQTN